PPTTTLLPYTTLFRSELVFTLRASLEDPDAAFYAEIQRLVIAHLEMQQREVADRAPVTAVQHLRRENIEGARDRLSIELGKDHEDRKSTRLNSSHGSI